MKHQTARSVNHLKVAAGIDCKNGNLRLGDSIAYELRIDHHGLREMEFRVTVTCRSANVSFSTGPRSRGRYTLSPSPGRRSATHPATVIVASSAIAPLPDTSDVRAKIERRRPTAKSFTDAVSVGVPISIN